MTKLLTHLLATVVFALPSQAMAQPKQAIARLTLPLRGKDKIVVGDTLWRCIGKTCAGHTDGRVRSSIEACRKIARKAGPIKSFRAGDHLLDQGALEECNRRARGWRFPAIYPPTPPVTPTY